MEHYTFPNSAIPAAYGPYSHAVVAGDFVFLAGQTARAEQAAGKLAASRPDLVRRVVEHFDGQLIYAGGDDVLAMVPAAAAMDCARYLMHHKLDPR